MSKLPSTDPSASIPEVIVIGEALTDIVVSPTGTVGHPGGSPMNVAYGLGRLGVATALLTSIGDDERGLAIENHLGGVGVGLLSGSKTPGKTSSAVASLAADGSASYEFDVRWTLEPTALETLPKLIHTGSIATFLAPGATTVRTLLQQANGQCVVTYDPNIRPALLGSQAEACSIFEDLVPLTDVVKLSDEDAAWLYPTLDAQGVAARILRLGAELVVVTMGAQGSLLATTAAELHVPAVSSVVADTIGAGDSYMAALIHGLLDRGRRELSNEALATLGRAASAAAATTVRRHGANPPTLHELSEMLV
ncbi:carbohydrate kinase family protein [Paeniglutamicibacter terrestris]|uniref:Carbohydrate kinase n=1 Tax=Paeniglutamicibacter terrestris TaxID=2723403 RepID=A0ABX1G2F8_9MICC|nr:carbohydrate kinase [Paeniglutamicibacter terrestris]NKG19936.1 carbohydrate kinase [Paeniglutamicibacter terrestris]